MIEFNDHFYLVLILSETHSKVGHEEAKIDFKISTNTNSIIWSQQWYTFIVVKWQFSYSYLILEYIFFPSFLIIMINFWYRFNWGLPLYKKMVIKFNHNPNYACLLVRRLWDRDQCMEIWLGSPNKMTSTSHQNKNIINFFFISESP